MAWLENRITEQDVKIDALYGELRNVQREKLVLLQKYNQQFVELEGVPIDYRQSITHNRYIELH